ncbi:MAG TPA: cation:proton antiporter [Bryobacteraceae bacterium]|jgi:Kef-type K+ transport system membrane component KefB|nr:cation:proton antiporter [Bryobacteraceae bacterium]
MIGRLACPPLAALIAAPEGAAIALAMLLVFGGAKLMAELFERLGQPGIVGEILVGVIVGPGLLGWIAPNAVLTALADLGVMFLLFRVGLEVKPRELMRVGPTATLVATLGVIVPFALGWAILALWGAPRIEAIFVGAAMVATSVGITAQVLASKGLLHHIASQTILAAAVIDDVLGLLVLAVVSSMAKGKVNVLELAGAAVVAVAFTVTIAKWGTGAMMRVMPRVEARLRAGNVQFNIAMILLFGLALLATYAGVAAIIGAFLAGMALSESLDRRVYQLVDGVTELLLPFFLVGIGLHLNLSPFAHASTLMLAAVIIVAAVLSKLIGCGLGALPMGFLNAVRVGCGMAPRGEVGMVVAQIGLGLGVIAQSIYGIVVFMAVATTLIAPPLIHASFRNAVREPAVEEFKVQ